MTLKGIQLCNAELMRQKEYLVYDLLKSIDKNDGLKFEEVVCHAENGVDILPCNINMSNADVIISGLHKD